MLREKRRRKERENPKRERERDHDINHEMSDSEFETLDYSQRFSGQKWKQRVSSVIINHFQFQIIVKNWANSDVLFFQVTRIPSYNGNELIHSENAIFYDAINLTYYEVTNYFLFFFLLLPLPFLSSFSFFFFVSFCELRVLCEECEKNWGGEFVFFAKGDGTWSTRNEIHSWRK